MKHRMLIVLAAVVLLVSVFAPGVSADGGKTLYFNSFDGKLQYNSANTAGADQFMMFENMQSDRTYTDTLTIRNETRKEYELYFQMLQNEDTPALSSELLRALELRVYDGEIVLYSGTVDGMIRAAGSADLREMTSIGMYRPGEERQLRAEVRLNLDHTGTVKGRYYIRSQYLTWEKAQYVPETEPVSYLTQDEATAAANALGERDIIYYGETVLDAPDAAKLAGVLAQTTWRFYAESEDVILPIQPPSTEDAGVTVYVIIAVAAAALVLVMLLGNRKKQPTA